jgi:hypothetical protein
MKPHVSGLGDKTFACNGKIKELEVKKTRTKLNLAENLT